MKLETLAVGSFVLLVVYGLAVYVQLDQLALLLFCLSPLLIIYLVLKTLKDKYEPKESFDEVFYQDRPEEKRNV